MKVSIVGFAPSTNHRAPWRDPEWEKWGLPWDPEYWPRMDRYFEMHDQSIVVEVRQWDFLKELEQPIYMQRHWPEIPFSVAYPFDEVNETVFSNFHRKWDQEDWYNSSIAYMIALAIHEKAETIGIWGVDVADDTEWAYESNCLDYLIGKAEGMGIKVITPEGPTALGQFRSQVYNKRYGYL